MRRLVEGHGVRLREHDEHLAAHDLAIAASSGMHERLDAQEQKLGESLRQGAEALAWQRGYDAAMQRRGDARVQRRRSRPDEAL